MKKMVFLLMALGLVACGVKTNKEVISTTDALEGRACVLNSSFLGQWKNDISGEILVISSDCAIETDQCEVDGIATQDQESAGRIYLNITSNNGGATCLPVNQYSCSYNYSVTTLSVECDGSTFTYTRQ